MSGPAHSKVAQARRELGRAAIFTVAEAATLLPMADPEATAALEAAGLVRLLDGRRVVIWGHVLDWIDTLTPTPAAPRPKKRAPARPFVDPSGKSRGARRDG